MVPTPSRFTADSPVTVLPGVGPERAAQLERLGVRTTGDLLLLRPRRHEDRRGVVRIADIMDKGPVTTRGRVVSIGRKYFRHRSRSVVVMILDDGTARLHCRWWNLPYVRFEAGQELMVHGRVVELKPRTIDHPETEVIDLESEEESRVHVDRIVPIYPLTEGLGQRWLRARAWIVVNQLAPEAAEPVPGLPRGGLPTRAEALRQLHFPDEPAQVELARRRLAFDEFVELQMGIQRRRRNLMAHAAAPPCGGRDNRWIRPFLRRLEFQLTPDQAAVLRDIRRDMSGRTPMRRLLQGDVGSGKTVVAAAAALMALECGHSAAIMAPTEILAQQHWRRFHGWFGPLGIGVDLLTGSQRVRADAGERSPRLFVGTHALLGPGFARDDLGLVIIDEQHKFGVSQREAFVRKGRFPHLLVMTATPIPRTLALTLYGDLDVSVIRHGPPGRGRVRTHVRSREALGKVWQFVREQVESGRQAYVVVPRVEQDEDGSVMALKREYAVVREALSPHEVAMIHGGLPAAEKERVMRAFAEGRVQVLMGTVVIEVGVDVANATVMVVQDADRFGLAQLHQLRGRIGRGSEESHCILVAGRETPEARERLRVLEETTDGFAIAEADLRLRGAGELLGQAQSGLPPLRFGDLLEDRELVELARRVVAEHLPSPVGREDPPSAPEGSGETAAGPLPQK